MSGRARSSKQETHGLSKTLHIKVVANIYRVIFQMAY